MAWIYLVLDAHYGQSRIGVECQRIDDAIFVYDIAFHITGFLFIAFYASTVKM